MERKINLLCWMSRDTPERRSWLRAKTSAADFRVIIASSFADIFANNSLKNGLLTVRLSDDQVAEITGRAKSVENYTLSVDLEILKVEDGRGFSTPFSMDEFSRHCLLNGLDDIGLTLQHEPEILAYEAKHPVRAEMKSVVAG